MLMWSLLTAFGIALHIFVIMMETGATQAGMVRKRLAAISGIFLTVQLAVLASGIFLTWWIKQYLQIASLERLHKMVYLLLFLGIGLQILLKLRQTDGPDERKRSPLTLTHSAFLSFRTSAQALLLGMTMFGYASLPAGLFIIALGFSASFGGFYYGFLNGVRNEKFLCAVDGILVFFLICRVLVAGS